MWRNIQPLKCHFERSKAECPKDSCGDDSCFMKFSVARLFAFAQSDICRCSKKLKGV
jgi:hypothetical protein